MDSTSNANDAMKNLQVNVGPANGAEACPADVPGVEGLGSKASEQAASVLAIEVGEAGAVGVIPVGQEPAKAIGPQLLNSGEVGAGAGYQGGRSSAGANARQRTGKVKDRYSRSGLRNPDGFYKYKNRLDELRVFRRETMRHLRRRAEICVWLAIHGCQHDGAAQISQKRIAELAGIRGKRHVVDAIRGLRDKGLLEVLSQGRYRPNGAEEYGLSSVYRVYPRPEPRLLKAAELELGLKLEPESEVKPGESGASTSSQTSSSPSLPTKPR